MGVEAAEAFRVVVIEEDAEDEEGPTHRRGPSGRPTNERARARSPDRQLSGRRPTGRRGQYVGEERGPDPAPRVPQVGELGRAGPSASTISPSDSSPALLRQPLVRRDGRPRKSSPRSPSRPVRIRIRSSPA